MINVNMTDKAGVTLATAGKYCADNVKVTPSAEILRKDEQAKSATPTETAQDITPDSGKVLSKVSVGAIPKTYVGSGVTKKAAATVAPSTSEQTVCASGVYTTGEQKVSAITPSIVGNLDASSFAASIVAAIEGKGVDVPSGAKLDALAALIASIEAGGGGKFASGTITSAKDISLGPDANFEIETGFLSEKGKMNFVLLLLNGALTSGQYNTHFIGYQSNANRAAIAYKTVSNTRAEYDTMYYDASSQSTYFKYDNKTGIVTLNGKSSSQKLNTYFGNSKISWAIWVD